jgi:hypothetical protein
MIIKWYTAELWQLTKASCSPTLLFACPSEWRTQFSAYRTIILFYDITGAIFSPLATSLILVQLLIWFLHRFPLSILIVKRNFRVGKNVVMIRFVHAFPRAEFVPSFAVNSRVMRWTLIWCGGNRLLGDFQLGKRAALRPHAPCIRFFCVLPLVVKKAEKESGFYFRTTSVIGVCFRLGSRSAFFLVSLSFLFILFLIFSFLWLFYGSVSSYTT